MHTGCAINRGSFRFFSFRRKFPIFFFLVKWFDFTIPRINKGRVKDKDLVFPECVSAKDCERSRILFVRIEFTPCKSCEILLDIFMGGKDREKRSLLFIPADHPTLYFISNF